VNDLHHAIRIAVEYHQYQLDKCGEPYVLHPLRVMILQKTNERRIIAVLHDVVEDTSSTFEFLSKYFDEDIVMSVVALTKSKNEDYYDYIERCKKNENAKYVKIGDIADNLSGDRLAKLDSSTRERLEKKYRKAMEILLS